MFAMIALALASFTAGLLVMALIGLRIIGMVHDEAARFVDGCVCGGQQRVWSPMEADTKPLPVRQMEDMECDALSGRGQKDL